MTERKVKAADAIRAGDRRALARAITLVESTRPADREIAESLLTELLPDTGRAMRIGISGAPGAGKSTFIEAFGQHLTGQGKTVAVLAVDPSSRRSGGSILGDKTRMEKLARDPGAFIRPSPAGETLGGVARRTREAMLLVEASGFDVVLVETVGVGQSETAVADMADLFVLLVPPGGGDDLQGIKRGVMELADLVLITKSDGDLLQAANRAAADYHAALHLMRPKYSGASVDVLKVSALLGEGIGEAQNAMERIHESLSQTGQLKKLREDQLRRWFWSEVQSALHEELLAREDLASEAQKLEASTVAGHALPFAAARSLFRRIFAA
ncbi:MAG TPA: methylmalonyl Co-A mutase-associated GTPase MeaB [Rhizomicrobium sp.]|jgi:LAO/AO transport system kinase|nr:methylmalonyl Co-A mutase-associated GTPase MeaB [Rhizomicrobium sp.]